MIALPSNFDNVAAVELYDALRMLPMNADVLLDAAPMHRISTLAVQLLLALDASLAQQGHKLQIANASQDFADTMTDIGLADVMARWSVA